MAVVAPRQPQSMLIERDFDACDMLEPLRLLTVRYQRCAPTWVEGFNGAMHPFLLRAYTATDSPS